MEGIVSEIAPGHSHHYSPLENQRGMVLILAVGMIAVLSLIGVVLLTTTTRDLGFAGRYQGEKEAFYAAERAVEYSLNRDMILNMGAGANLMTGVDSNGNLHAETINAGGKGQITAGTVTDIGPGELPVRLAEAYGTDFGANYYDVSVTAEAANGAEVRIDTQVVRLFKLDEDSIFITTGSGK